MRVVATAGHVDHGKSSLINALTGTDPDRLPEEKARGLTIDLGFAFTTLPSGQLVGFVDVPGHARFVKNMVAGVGAVDLALLVVAANEGWMAQTEEHVTILELLGVERGIVALTKADVTETDTLEISRLQVEARLPHWPVVVVDSLSGRGVDAVRNALDDALRAVPPARDDGRPRLWVDRVFSARGAGTVVTGTLAGGALAVDDEIVVAGTLLRTARIRGIESHGTRAERVAPVARVALNLAGVDHHEIARGAAVVRADQWQHTDVVDVALVAAAGVELPRRRGVHAHVGSGEYEARLRLLDGDGRFARVHLPVSLPLAPGDRFVLRSSARQATVGGAIVLDVAPARSAAGAVERLTRPLPERVMHTNSWRTAAELDRLIGATNAATGVIAAGAGTAVGDWIVAPAELARVRAIVTDAVADTDGPGVTLGALAAAAGIDTSRLRVALVGQPAVTIDHDLVRAAGAPGVADDPEAHRFLAALTAAPFSPPAPNELDASSTLVRALVRSGQVVDLDGVIFHADAFTEARRRIAAAVVARGTLTIADARDLLSSTRKYVMPIVNRLDAEGVTRRRGDERVPGPRAELFARE